MKFRRKILALLALASLGLAGREGRAQGVGSGVEPLGAPSQQTRQRAQLDGQGYTTPNRLPRSTIVDGEGADGASGSGESDPDAADGQEALSEEAAQSSAEDEGGQRDADLSRDGLIADVDLVPPSDGTDPLKDTRPPEDVAVFEQPPAGYDPLLFQIEDIDPIETDRRPARLARLEPYDPVGVRIGTFVLFPEAEVAGLLTDNVLSAANAVSDRAVELKGTSRLVSNWSRHALELKGSLAATRYAEQDSEDGDVRDAEVRGRLDVTRRTNVQASAAYQLTQEQRSGIDANRSSERADVNTTSAALAFNHRFNRLSLALRGSVVETDYAATTLADNRDRDTRRTEQAIRAKWEFKPTLSAFGEVEINQVDTGAPAASDGISRDASGERYRVGLDFGSSGQILRGEISLGYGRQEPDDARLKSTHAFLFDANLAWRPTELTTLLLTAKTDLSQSTGALVSGAVSQQVGVEARHALRRYLIASAGITYTDYDYNSSPVEEGALEAALGAEYFASPELVLFARYQHLAFSSNQAGGDYETNVVRAGVRVRR